MGNVQRSDEHAERRILGALMDAGGPLLRSTAAELIAGAELTAECFSSARLRTVFGAVAALTARGRPTDAETVFGVSARQGLPLEELLQLHGGNTVNRAAFAECTERVRKMAALRKLDAFYREQLEALSRPDADPVHLATAVGAFAQSFVGANHVDTTGLDDWNDLMEDWDAFMHGKRESYIATGIQALDDEIGGFVNNLNVIGGLPSIGKTALAHTIIINNLLRGVKVGLFGLEDGTRPLIERHVARVLGIPIGDVAARRINEHQADRLQSEGARLCPLLPNLLTYRWAGIEPEVLVQTSKRWVLTKGVKLIVVDHGGEVQHASRQVKDRYDLAVADTYRQLRDLAVNHRVPVVVLSHLTRRTEDTGRPTMQSFAESAYIERMARLALGLWARPAGHKDKDRTLMVTVLKRTKGRRDVTLELTRHMEASLVRNEGGQVVDLEAEAQATAEEKAAKVVRTSPSGSWSRPRP